jgi:D-sedoheptulose 7-phosphate isomerase
LWDGIEEIMKNSIEQYLKNHIKTMEMVIADLVDDIASSSELIIETLRSGHKILVAGNGGSAADAQHLAAEFVGRFLFNRQALPAIALTTDTSILTAVGNDFGFEKIFSRQVEALAQEGDLLLGISTSGRSVNIMNAFDAARQRGCRTLALTGCDGGPMLCSADQALVVPAKHTPHIQEAHLTMIHILCDLVEQALGQKCEAS